MTNPNTKQDLAVSVAGLRDPEKTIRELCMHELVRIGEVAVPYLINIADDPDWRVRYRSAEALGLIRSSLSDETLIKMTSDEKDHVRYMAAKGLRNLTDQKVVGSLIHLLSDNHSYTRAMAAKGLAEIREPIAIPEVERALKKEMDPDVRSVLNATLDQLKLKH